MPDKHNRNLIIMGEYRKAEPLMLKAIEIHMKVLSEEHPEYASSLNNLAGLYFAMGEYGKAESFYLQSIAIHKSNVAVHGISVDNVKIL